MKKLPVELDAPVFAQELLYRQGANIKSCLKEMPSDKLFRLKKRQLWERLSLFRRCVSTNGCIGEEFIAKEDF